MTIIQIRNMTLLEWDSWIAFYRAWIEKGDDYDALPGYKRNET